MRWFRLIALSLIAAVLCGIVTSPAIAQFAIFQVASNSTPSVQWTTLTPTGTLCGTGNNTCVIKVSSSAGNDATCATTSPPIVQNTDTSACQTIAKAITLLRDGKPDWLLLKTGDTWTNDPFGLLKVSGLSQSQLMVVASYGTSTTRPIVQLNAANSPCIGASSVTGVPKADYMAVVGIDFYAYTRDPNNGSFSLADATTLTECFQWQLATWNYLLFENNFIHYFNTQFDIDTNGGAEPAPPPLAIATLVMNGNIITDAYPATINLHSQGGFFSGIGNITFTFNVFDNNGWNGKLYGPYSASMTCASPAVFTVTATPFPFKAGSVVTLNGTPCTGFSTNHAYCVINVSGNTFNVTQSSGTPCPNGTTTLNGTGSSSGLTATANDFQAQIFNRNIYTNGSPSTASNNISSNSSAEGAQFRYGGGPWTNNLWVNNSTCFTIGDGISGSVAGVVSNNVCMNSVDIVQGTGNLVRGQGIGVIQGNSGVQLTKNLSSHVTNTGVNNFGIQLDAATVGSVASPGNVVCWPTVAIQDLGTGDTVTGNTTTTSNVCAGQGFSDPTRTVATYDSTVLGGPGTIADFISCARGNSKAAWNAACTASNANAWIRPGYNMTP